MSLNEYDPVPHGNFCDFCGYDVILTSATFAGLVVFSPAKAATSILGLILYLVVLRSSCQT